MGDKIKKAAPESTWVLGSNIEIPATFYVLGARIHKFHCKKFIKNADAGKNLPYVDTESYSSAFIIMSYTSFRVILHSLVV